MNCLYFAEEVLRNEFNKMLVKFTVLIELKSRSFCCNGSMLMDPT